jgi:hypothetical protein
MKQKDTVAIAWAHDQSIDTEFALSVMEIIRQRGKRVGSYYCVEGTGLLSKSRNIMVKHFLDNTTDDWLFMVDDDERIPLQAFDTLVATADSTERPVVAGLYFAALWEGLNLRPVPLIFKQDDNGAILPIDDYPKDSVIPVVAAGTGCLLIHRSVFQKIRSAHDENNQDWCWFQDGPIGGNKWLSEDLSFCAKLQQFGIPMVAHTGATLAHHKMLWVDSAHHDAWLQNNEPGAGLGQLQ